MQTARFATRVLVVTLLALVLAPKMVWAQSAIAGVVRDTTGAVKWKATLTSLSTQKNQRRFSI